MTKINDNQESNYPSGFSGGVSIRNVSILNVHSGKVYWVDSNGGSDGNQGTRVRPFATIGGALAVCEADQGNVIMVKSGHAETISAAAGIAVNVAGVTILGLGTGSDRPTLTFGTATTASLTVTAANITIQNIVGVTAFNALTKPFDVTGNDCYLDIEWQDPSTILEAVSVVRATTVSRLSVKLKYKGQTGGSSCVNPIKLIAVTGGRINIDFVGKASTAVVNFVTTLSTDIVVNGYMYNSSVTTGAKDIVDTIGSSTWFGQISDGSDGAVFSGGSGLTWAADDISTIVTDLAVPTADATTNVYARDVTGNKTDAAVTAVGTTKTLMAYLKGLITMGTVQTADSTANAFEGDVTGNKTDAGVTAVGTTKSITAYVKGHTTMLTVQSADSTNNAFAGDVVGNKTDASVYVPGTTSSIAALVKGHADLQERVATSATAVMVNGNTLFTVAGGPIEVLALISTCVTANNGTASTLQYSATPTIGAAQTISGASASLAAAAAGATVALQGTALATAALLNANGPNLNANPGTIHVPAGTITAVIGVGSTTGTWKHQIRYKPLAAGVTVS